MLCMELFGQFRDNSRLIYSFAISKILKMKKLVLMAVAILTAQFGFSQETTFKDDVMKFFELSGGGGGIEAIADQVLPMIDEDQHEDFKKDFSIMIDDFYSKTAEVFQEEFTHEDIKSLNSIIEKGIAEEDENLGELIQASEAGKKFLEKEEVIDEKMQTKLMTWGLELQMMMSKYGIE